MWSKDGQIQGDPLAMFLYGIGIIPLIRKLKVLHPDIVQPWYADDDAALAEWLWLVQLFVDLLLIPKRVWIISKPSKM